ncbi:MAG: hypothetical protein ACRAVC_05235 [Trichormus sp.]
MRGKETGRQGRQGGQGKNIYAHAPCPIPNQLTKSNFFAMIKHVFSKLFSLTSTPHFVLIGI